MIQNNINYFEKLRYKSPLYGTHKGKSEVNHQNLRINACVGGVQSELFLIFDCLF